MLLDDIFSSAKRADFGTLALIDIVSFLSVCAVCLIACISLRRLRSVGKRPFLHLVNAFAAVTLAVFSLRYSLSGAVFAAVAVWLTGYLVYGVLCALSHRKRSPQPPPVRVIAEREKAPVCPRPHTSPAHSAVRLEHALSITDRLLAANPGRGDRQELEKMRTALTLLKVKGSLSPDDGEALNEIFNALLKLMAKYNV